MPRVTTSARRGRNSPRNSVKDRPARWRMWVRRARRGLRPAAWTLAAMLVAGFGFSLVHAWSPGGTLSTMRERLGVATGVAGLRVRNIVVEGRANTPEPLLRAAIGASKGDAILGFSVEQARTRIEGLTWVESATVERRLPDTLVIQLAERRPFAIWQNQGKFVLVDRAGLIVANQDVAQFRALPLIVGLGAPAAAAPLLDALTARPGLGARVTAAVRVAERRWNLHMKSGTDVLLPEGAEVAALEKLDKLQQDQALLDRPLAVIDMRLPDKLVVRPMASDGRSDANPGNGSAGETVSFPVPPAIPASARSDPARPDAGKSDTGKSDAGRIDPMHADPGRATGPKRPT
jgi:cell division protein FtsQ